MTPYELGSALWRQRLLATLVLLTVVAASTIGVLVAPKTYSSTGGLTVVTAGAPGDAGARADGQDLDARRATLADLASSRLVTGSVSADLAADAGVRRSPEQLRLSVQGTWVEGTAVVEVTAEDHDPQVAALVVQETLEVLQVGVPVAEGLAFTVTTPPRPPATWSSPDLLLVGGAGLLVGLVLACVAAVVRDRTRATVDDGRVAEEAAGAPLLSHVWPPDDPTTLPALAPGTVASEGFRHLRRAVDRQSRPDDVGFVVVAGLGGEQTHVWVGANLAIALALEGRSVLLVDARDTGASPPVADSPGSLGFADVLAGAPLQDAVSPGPVAGLSVMPAGERARHRGDLPSAMVGFKEQARRHFDVVVALPPRLDESEDALVMADEAAILLTLTEHTVSIARLRRHAARSRARRAKLLGVVLVGGHAREVR